MLGAKKTQVIYLHLGFATLSILELLSLSIKGGMGIKGNSLLYFPILLLAVSILCATGMCVIA